MAGQGWRGLFRGNLVNVIRSSLSRGLDFWGFDQFKGWLGDGGPDVGHAPWRTFAAAGCAGATSWLLL
jgi:solute carrier family 25 phosphate transporter 23/24/25/41